MSKDHLSSHPKWDHDQFLTFLLLYASMADMEYTEDEREYIRSKTKPDVMKAVQGEFDECKDYECLQIIEAYRNQFFSTPEDKAELLLRLEELFESDGKYTTTENSLFLMLRKIL